MRARAGDRGSDRVVALEFDDNVHIMFISYPVLSPHPAVQQLAANCRIVRIRLIRIQPMRIKVPSTIKTQFKITVAGFDPGAVFIAEINRLTIGNADMGQCHQA